nr:MAG TPA: hypothetical protein [Caudoviricetes sp.]
MIDTPRASIAHLIFNPEGHFRSGFGPGHAIRTRRVFLCVPFRVGRGCLSRVVRPESRQNSTTTYRHRGETQCRARQSQSKYRRGRPVHRRRPRIVSSLWQLRGLR